MFFASAATASKIRSVLSYSEGSPQARKAPTPSEPSSVPMAVAQIRVRAACQSETSSR